MSLIAIPPLAAFAAFTVVKHRWRAAALAGAGSAALDVALGGPLSGGCASALCALSALSVGVALARLIPRALALRSVLCMCTLDSALMLAGVGKTPGALAGATYFHGPRFDNAHVGPLVTGYPDLLLAATIGGLLAGAPHQRRSAALTCALVALYGLALLFVKAVPATVPLALTLLLAQSYERRRGAQGRAA